MATKRSTKGTGSFSKQQNGKYKYTFTIGTTIDGKQKRMSVSGKTKKECFEKAEIKKATQNITFKGNRLVTLKDLINLWLKLKEDRITERTLDQYNLLKNYYLTDLLEYRVQDITTDHLIRVLDDKFKDLQASSRNIYLSKIKSLFTLAVDQNYITKNPCNHIKKYKDDRQLTEKDIPTVDQAKAILKLAKEDQKRQDIYHFIVLAIYTGARLGELLGLQWQDIDLNNSQITINKQLADKELRPPKTKNSIRTLYVQKEVLVNLMALKGSSKSTDRIFSKRSVISFKLTIKKLAQAVLGQNTTLSSHSFRHFHATMLISKGYDIKSVSCRLGHTNINTTLNHYAHWLKTNDLGISKAFEKDFI